MGTPSFFQPAAVSAVQQRIAKLTADRQPLWGNMSAATMMQHCRIINESLLRGRPSTRMPSLKQRLLRRVFLSRLIPLPKGRKQPGHIADRMNAAGTPAFDAERLSLLASIAAFAAHSGGIDAAHPIFGRMSRQNWGRFGWVHLDHHLRQFGV